MQEPYLALQTDGAVNAHSEAAIGFVATWNDGTEEMAGGYCVPDIRTTVGAEVRALHDALTKLLPQHADVPLQIQTDLEVLATRLPDGEAPDCAESRLLFRDVKTLLEGFGTLVVEYVQSEENAADGFAAAALDDGYERDGAAVDSPSGERAFR